LLLDEPLSNLDANLRQEVAREIRRLQRAAGLTALMVTHDQDEAMAMADRLVVMDRGRVQQVGPQEALYEAPENPFVARFIGHSNLLRGSLRDGCRLRLGEGVVCHLAQRYPLDGDVTLALRPERIRLLRPGDAATPRLTLAVEDATYVGAHVEYLLALPGGGSLILHQPTTGQAEAPRLAPGSRAALTWDCGSERVFDAAGRALAAAGPSPAFASA
ncbi:ABC transporter ATP-binding protein, partial [Teichococcus deserti]|uniref:ABC transporter ATP-binding protein n=1 Tax=Teichococcus deserti TaxID=1817963 RepID=UPI001054F291